MEMKCKPRAHREVYDCGLTGMCRVEGVNGDSWIRDYGQAC